MDFQRARAAHNQALFRHVNNRIEEFSERFQLQEETLSCVCECSDVACIERIGIPPGEYQRIRRHPNEFIIKPRHEIPQVEEVAHREMRWIVVRKLGVGADVEVDLETPPSDDSPVGLDR